MRFPSAVHILTILSILLLLPCLPRCAGADTQTVWLGELDLSGIQQGWGEPQTDRSVTGKTLSIGGQTFERGLGTHAPVQIELDLDGKVERFQALVGVDDAAGSNGTIRFVIYGADRRLFDSGAMKGGEPAKPVDLSLEGMRRLVLVVTDGGDGRSFDHADWAEARFTVAGAAPVVAAGAAEEERVILTSEPGPAPRINGPRVYGVRPGRAVVFRIPTTGDRPIRFAARALPESLSLDRDRGIVTGNAPAKLGEYRVTFRAENRHGRADRRLTFVVGDTIALTPPMGWNHWYTHYANITDRQIREAADAMVASGMADVGYAYVSIDDCWMVKPGSDDPMLGGEPRDAEGAIRPNGHFPDMKALTDHIHAYGLKAGIYTSPGPRTCGGYEGSYQHEEIDARKFAEWGFDLLKYDWCSYGRVVGGETPADRQKPYRLMGDILKGLDRDIVFNLCQYGMANVWEWGAEVGGQSWRTGGDLGFELERFFEVALRNAELREYVHPGAWNDPDYLLLGPVGHPRRQGEPPQPCPLTPGEQYAYMSLWCMMAAPLFLSGDITRLDEFTLNVLCNPEVIEVNQDPLGRSARVVARDEEHFVMVKEMGDGSRAVGLFNLAPINLQLTASWADLGLQGPQRVRDLWRQKDLGTINGEFSAEVGARSVVLVRMWPAR